MVKEMNSLKGSDILSTKVLTRTNIEKILDTAKSMEVILNSATSAKLLEGKIMGSLFFQSSTRTRLSFESAMHRLGGSVIGFADPRTSRSYGPRAETLEDTIRVIERYCDVIVLRHPENGAAQRAANIARVPILNGGDGTNEHPTQALLDTHTIWREKGKLDGLTVGLVGDLRSTRAMHSLAYALGKFDLKLLLISPPQLSLPTEIKDYLSENPAEFEEFTDIEDAISLLDVMYVTRVNKEGAKNEEEYNKLLKIYPRITLDLVKRGKPDLIVMHDLPRTDELGLQIAAEVDETPQAKYFDEVEYGVATRMALLALTLGALE